MKMRFNSKIYCFQLIWLIVFIFFFVSCTEKNFNLEKLSPEVMYNPKLSLSIGTTTFTVDQVLSHYDTSSFLKQDPQGMFYIIYEKDLISYAASDKIPVPGQQEIIIPSLILPTTFDSKGQASQQTTFTFPMTFGSSQEIDSMILKSMMGRRVLHYGKCAWRQFCQAKALRMPFLVEII